MRRMLVMLAACGGVPATTPTPPRAKAVRHVGPGDPTPVDVIAALAPAEDGQVSWLDPGTARLELGGAAFEAPDGATPIAVSIVETQGSQLHVAVRLEDARFAVWTDRARQLAVAKRDVRVVDFPHGNNPWHDRAEIEGVIHANAHLQVLARKEKWAQVRYAGAVEIEGWVPEADLGERGAALYGIAFFPNHMVVNVMPGAVLRDQPNWQGRQLAVVATSYFLDKVKEVDDTWTEVAYADSDVTVRGFVSRQEPPGRLHHPRRRDVGVVLTVPNASLRSGTCLYTRANGDPIGYLVGDRVAELVEGTQRGWSTIAIDTPWGALAFAAKGGTRAELELCAPPGAVPAPAPSVP